VTTTAEARRRRSGRAAAGIGVERLGVLPTPGVAYYCEREGVPAVHVTASHNPPEYNGIKLLGADGTELAVDASVARSPSTVESYATSILYDHSRQTVI